ncbi:hypothetical protein [Desulfosporosinus sp. SB140]|uniref:hypothetical protein n=1 Tax=Desulfosporosinus paludis TaxID=3115649 RepID=UPI00388F5F50
MSDLITDRTPPLIAAELNTIGHQTGNNPLCRCHRDRLASERSQGPAYMWEMEQVA